MLRDDSGNGGGRSGAAHMAGGLRLLMLEFLAWRDWQKSLLAAATGLSIAVGLAFLLNLLHDQTFVAGDATTTLVDSTPGLFRFTPPRDRATKLLRYIGNVIVNGRADVKKRYEPTRKLPVPTVPRYARPALSVAGSHAGAAVRTGPHARSNDAIPHPCSSPRF